MFGAFHQHALHGGVGGDHAVDFQVGEHARSRIDIAFAEVGRDLHQHRYVLSVLGAQPLLLLAQRTDQAAQRLFLLQLAQPRGVGRRDVDGYVVRQRIHAREAVHVVAFGCFVRCVLVLADIDAEQATALRALDVAHQRLDAVVVESQAVDHRAVPRQAEHARFRVAGLRLGRDRADLDEAEAQRQQCVDVRAVLVETRGEANWIREGQAEGLGREGSRFARHQRIETGAVRSLKRVERERMRTLGVETEQEWARKPVHQRLRPWNTHAASHAMWRHGVPEFPIPIP